MEGVSIIKNQLWLSYTFLKANGITEKQLELWSTRKISRKKRINGVMHVLYDSIIEDARLKQLPPKEQIAAQIVVKEYEGAILGYRDEMEQAKEFGFMPFYNEMKSNYDLMPEKLVNMAKLAAVWHWILSKGGRDNKRLYEALNILYEGKYSFKTFNKKKSEAQRNGALSVAFDTRAFSSPQNCKKISDAHDLGIRHIISDGRARSGRAEYRDFCEYCDKVGIEKIALKTFTDRKAELLNTNISINESRYGKSKAAAKMLPHASMMAALDAYDQWQMDGYNPPIWVKNSEGRYKKWAMVVVMDACTKKIVGHAYGETENTITIMAALRDAIVNTGCLPFEIVADNHSFNQTKEAAFFKAETEKLGMRFTVTSNPQHKSIIERHNKHLDSHFREHYGYTSEGVKSRSKNASVSQELLDEYIKHPVSEGELKILIETVANGFNKAPLAKYGKCPNDMFEESKGERRICLTMAERMRVLTAKTESTISRNQITIKRGLTKYEYQLPASLFEKYNNTTVTVRYEDLSEGIYIYEKDTDKAITDLRPKQLIHGALANQTERDIELLNQDKGRKTGVKIKAKNDNQRLLAKVSEQYPQAAEILNALTTPKNVIQAIEADTHLKQTIRDKGIDVKMVVIPERKGFTDKSLQPVSTKKDTAVVVKNNKIGIVDFNK